MKFLSWIVLIACAVAAYFLSQFCFWLVAITFGAIGTLPIILRWVIYLVAGSAIAGIALVPIFYGPTLMITASEAVSPSHKGVRYKFFAVLFMFLTLLDFIIELTYASNINAADIAVFIMSIILLVQSAKLIKERHAAV